jgi:hypothetical protein
MCVTISEIYHAYERDAVARGAPSIPLPSPFLPPYLTTSKPRQGQAGKGKATRVVGPRPAAPSITEDADLQNEILELRKRVLELVPGSPEAHQLFTELANLVTELFTSVKEQVQFVCDLCRAVWFREQGDFCFPTNGK